MSIAFGFIYNRLFHNKEEAEMYLFISRIFTSPSDYLLLAFVVALMFVNWGIESVKWKFLVGKIENMSLSKSMKSIFSGICVSVFTPNRIGEFGGRVFYIKRTGRIEGIFISLLGSLSQLLVTMITGSIAIVIYYLAYSGFIATTYFLYAGIAIAIMLFLLTLLYFNLYTVITRIKKMSISKNLSLRISSVPAFCSFSAVFKERILKRLQKYTEVFSLYSFKELALTLLFSFMRYAVFTFQFYFLLLLFKVNIPIGIALILISITFFAMTLIPTVGVVEFSIRGSAALFFIGLFSDNGIGILTSSLGLWVINLALPAIIGAWFIFGIKSPAALQKEHQER